MLTIWDLNAIVLCHLNRFFQTARQVVQQCPRPDEQLLSSILSLTGNMIWARSSFEAADEEEAREMAFTGALLGSVSDHAVEGLDTFRARGLALLASAEEQLLAVHDRLLDGLLAQLRRDGSQVSPASVNEAVWQRLFPGYPYGQSQVALYEQIRRRLVQQRRTAA
jgi:hypothetical protein